jgi:hypothetical protein
MPATKTPLPSWSSRRVRASFRQALARPAVGRLVALSPPASLRALAQQPRALAQWPRALRARLSLCPLSLLL